MEATKENELNKLKIRIENGVFQAFEGGGEIPVTEFTSTSISWEKWKGKIYPDGSIRLKAHLYSIGAPEENQKYVMFKITRAGYITLHKKRKNKPAKQICCKKITWPQDGVITLTDGNLSERHGFFGQKKYIDFLRKHSLEGVKKEDPNRNYLIYNDKENFRWIYTDGHVQEILEDFSGGKIVKVSEATWAITIRRTANEEKRNIYSLLNIEQLQDIPVI